MSIEILGKALADFNDRIKTEKGLGDQTTIELLYACDVFEKSVTTAAQNFREAISAAGAARSNALVALIVGPVDEPAAPAKKRRTKKGDVGM